MADNRVLSQAAEQAKWEAELRTNAWPFGGYSHTGPGAWHEHLGFGHRHKQGDKPHVPHGQALEDLKARAEEALGE